MSTILGFSVVNIYDGFWGWHFGISGWSREKFMIREGEHVVKMSIVQFCFCFVLIEASDFRTETIDFIAFLCWTFIDFIWRIASFMTFFLLVEVFINLFRNLLVRLRSLEREYLS